MHKLAEHHCLLRQSNCSSRPNVSPLALSRGSACGTGALCCGAAPALRTAHPACSCSPPRATRDTPATTKPDVHLDTGDFKRCGKPLMHGCCSWAPAKPVLRLRHAMRAAARASLKKSCALPCTTCEASAGVARRPIWASRLGLGRMLPNSCGPYCNALLAAGQQAAFATLLSERLYLSSQRGSSCPD